MTCSFRIVAPVKLLDKVEARQEVVITRRGKTMAHLSAAAGTRRPLPSGELARFRTTFAKHSPP